MTTINLEILRDRIVMATDGGFTGLQKPCPKVTPIPHLRAVIAGRGPMAITAWLPFFASQFDSLSEMRAGLPAILRKRYGLLSRVFPSRFKFEVVVAGYEHGSPVAFEIASTTWATSEILEFYAAPAVDTSSLPTVSATAPREIDHQAKRAMGALMERQRAEHGDIGCGGFGQITSVFPSGQVLTEVFAKF